MKPIRYSILFFILALVVSCNPKPKQPLTFKIPKLINTQVLDTNDIYKPRTKYNGEFPVELGRFRFTDTIIDLNPQILSQDSTTHPLWIDITWENEQRYKKFIDSNVFELIPDYETTIYFKYNKDVTKMYPVFLINGTEDTSIYWSHSSYGGATETYYDTIEESWIGIESIGSSSFNFCGCCNIFYLIPPNEFTILLFPKQDKGELFEVRTKIRMGNSNLSPVFKAKLDTALYTNGFSSDGTKKKILKSNVKR